MIMYRDASKFMIYIVLILLLGVAGCKDADRKNEAHLYEEKEIVLPANLQPISIKQMNEQAFLCFYLDLANDAYHLAYTDAELTTFTPIQNDLGALVERSESTSSESSSEKVHPVHPLVFDVDPLGQLYVLQFAEASNNPTTLTAKQEILVFDQAGVVQDTVFIEMPQHILDWAPTALIVQNDRFILFGKSGIQMVDRTGQTMDEIAIPYGEAVEGRTGNKINFPIGEIIDVDVMDEHRMVIAQEKRDGNYVQLYDLVHKETVWSHDFGRDLIPVKVHFETTTRKVFVASIDQVISFTEDGQNKTVVIDLNKYAAGKYTSPLFNDNDVLVPGHLYFVGPGIMQIHLVPASSHLAYNPLHMFDDPSSHQIKKTYAYRLLSDDEKRQALKQNNADKTKVNLFVPYANNVLKQKIARFEYLNPQVEVNLLYYREDQNEFNRQDYVEYASLLLLTNKPQWDAIILDYLPFQQYMKKGYFADLDQIGWSGWTKEKERFFPNILEAAEQDGKLMLLPAGISTQINIADMKATEHLQPFHYKWNDLLHIVDKTKQMNPDQIPWHLGLHIYALGPVFNEIFTSFEMDLMASYNHPAIQRQLLNELMDLVIAISHPEDHIQSPDEQPLFSFWNLSPTLILEYPDLIGVTKRLLPGPTTHISSQIPFTLQEGYSINQKSKVKEEALKLIFFLAEHANPVNMVFKETFVKMNEHWGTSEQQQAAIEQLRIIVEHLDVLYERDFEFRSAVFDPVDQLFMKGVLDKERTVQSIQERIKRYMNE